jgi:hypothetical protein
MSTVEEPVARRNRADDVKQGSAALTCDPAHQRPSGVDDATVEAFGKLTEAFEWLERARGRLYDFHQMVGHLDLAMSDAAAMLRDAGHPQAAADVERDVVGRNVLDGRWTFQVVEEFDDLYYEPVRAIERRLRRELVGGRRHLFEAELKERRRSAGARGHESRPPAAHESRVSTMGRPAGGQTEETA